MDITKIRLLDIVPLTGINSKFTYYTRNLTYEDLVGFRVLIPFGSRTLTGIVVSDSFQKQIPDNLNLKEVIEILDGRPIFSKKLIELAFWISYFYFAPVGEVFKAMLPPNFVTKKKTYIQISKDANIEMDVLTPTQKKVIEFLKRKKGRVAVNSLHSKLGISNYHNVINRLVSLRYIITNESIVLKTKKKMLLKLNIENFLNSSFDDVLQVVKRKKKIVEILKLLYEKVQTGEEEILWDTLRKEIDTNITQKILQQIAELGFISIEYANQFSGISYTKKRFDTRNELELSLNGEQRNALSSIIQAIEDGKYKSFLLFGVTGSGKTLIYMNAIRKCLEIGKTALILVPEISLTHQLVERFELAFPNQIAVLHSRLTNKERVEIWNSILYGYKRVVIGARSAVFAPLEKLGLIIVDEEHEPSFKQEDSEPRYHARDVALYRGKSESAVVILGSATPSVSSFFSAQKGKHKLLEIKNRADGAVLPKIYVIDISKSRSEHKFYGQFSAFLIEKISDRLKKREGIILFQNRRGFGLMVLCTKCGHIPKCPSCEVSLTYHKVDNSLKCHYCGFQVPFSLDCSKCGNPTMRYFGYGTQRVEEEVRENLTQYGLEAKVARFDLDIAKQNKEALEVLQKFNSGEIDILVGTQMIAKGLDFSRVTLVGIINADLQINLPDFTSAERAFQLFTQVAGRAGRKSDLPGEVVIQTNDPDSYVIRFFAEHDYISFYDKEILFRRQLFYPPFSRIIAIELRSKSNLLLKESEKKILDRLMDISFLRILGPVTPFVPKINGALRRVLILKVDKKVDPNGRKIYPILLDISQILNKFVTSKSLKIIVDVDSQFSLF
ncbi:MAG: replication restart helicase PriA [Candidatus Kapaibacteriales bacterium]